MTLTLNGKSTTLPAPLTLSGLLAHQKIAPGRVVVELNGAIPDKARYGEIALSEGDRVEVLQFMGGGSPEPRDDLVIAGVTVRSRLITGSGKYRDDALIPKVLEAAECDIITVALRRVDFDRPGRNLLSHIPKGKRLLPNTSGARTADEAVRIARLSRAMGCGDWIKIEVIRDQKYLLPDNPETVKASEVLVKEGFTVMPYISPDLKTAKRLEALGAASVMPLGSPIGSNRGLETRELLKILIAEIRLPVIVDAGIGAPSHAAEAMEMGAAAVLLNTAIATSDDPVRMAEAFKWAVRAGRQARLAGPASVSETGRASSPLTGFLGE